jgi:hypothetical protein
MRRWPGRSVVDQDVLFHAPPWHLCQGKRRTTNGSPRGLGPRPPFPRPLRGGGCRWLGLPAAAGRLCSRRLGGLALGCCFGFGVGVALGCGFGFGVGVGFGLGVRVGLAAAIVGGGGGGGYGGCAGLFPGVVVLDDFRPCQGWDLWCRTFRVGDECDVLDEDVVEEGVPHGIGPLEKASSAEARSGSKSWNARVLRSVRIWQPLQLQGWRCRLGWGAASLRYHLKLPLGEQGHLFEVRHGPLVGSGSPALQDFVV